MVKENNMAQMVKHMQNFETPEAEKKAYSEGPFVIVYINGWRIECEVVGEQRPAFPHLSIYQLRKIGGWPSGHLDKRAAIQLCNWLNQKVRDGTIIIRNDYWVLRKKE